MIEVDLYAANGVYVCTVTLPPFYIGPMVLQWGNRVFVWDAVIEQYREDMLWPCVGGHRFNGPVN